MIKSDEALSPRHIYDVLIVGAGPVGLATAVGLRKRGITNILVIDQTREFRNVGGRVDLLPNGLRAIKYIDSNAYEKIKEIASQVDQSPGNKRPVSNLKDVKRQSTTPRKRWCNKNLQGEITRSFPLDFESWCERYGEGRVSISWYNLQTSLRSLLPPDIVQANHRCVHVEEETGWVRIDSITDTTISSNPYAHWEMMQSTIDLSALTQDAQGSDRQSFFAKLVVAADGINSTIRQVLYDHQRLKERGKPQYSGFAGISSRIANVPTAVIEQLDTRAVLS